VGLYLVFATLIVPPLATRRMNRYRLATAWAIAAIGYAAGLLVSSATDLPTGAVIVWSLVVVGLAWYGAGQGVTRAKGFPTQMNANERK
jgi:zinc/manganese transport system permease protein